MSTNHFLRWFPLKIHGHIKPGDVPLNNALPLPATLLLTGKSPAHMARAAAATQQELKNKASYAHQACDFLSEQVKSASGPLMQPL